MIRDFIRNVHLLVYVGDYCDATAPPSIIRQLMTAAVKHKSF
jgi:hypothetical protein